MAPADSPFLKNAALHLLSEFRQQSQVLSSLLASLGITPRDALSNSFEKYGLLSTGDQQSIFVRLQVFTEICQRFRASQGEIGTEQTLTWYALQQLGLRPPAELFEKIEEQDAVEVYNADNIQIFRNLNFCRVSTYSLEDVLVFPWYELFHRDDFILAQMQAAAGQALTQTKIPIVAAIDPHCCREIRAPGLGYIHVRFKWISPLFSKDKSVSHFLVTSEVKRTLKP